jgi:uncharacterized protein YqhQ
MENDNLNIQNNEDLYSKKSDKIIDFILGFFGTFILLYVISFIISFLPSFLMELMPRGSAGFSPLLSVAISFLPVVIILVLIYKISKMKRRYIRKGVLYAVMSIFILPLLAFGACLITLSHS